MTHRRLKTKAMSPTADPFPLRFSWIQLSTELWTSKQPDKSRVLYNTAGLHRLFKDNIHTPHT